MSRIKARDTSPERIVRSLLHRMGYRFRVHVSNMVGRPDIVLPKWRRVIFVHGCFWHRHKRCKFAYTPKTRGEFWSEKFTENVRRDAVCIRRLRREGWRVTVVWECQTERPKRLAARLDRVIRLGRRPGFI